MLSLECKTMRLSGIPIIQPVPLSNDPCGPMGSPQPILQLKELAVDQVRYQEWKAILKREPKNRTPNSKSPLSTAAWPAQNS
jgi:hypothetical protein